MILVVIAIGVFLSVVYSMAKDLPAARFNLSCHGIYGKFGGKGEAECEACTERFECYTN